jgi:acylglycerol lipase
LKIYESSWQNAERIKFHVRGWEPLRPPKATVALVHGLGEHVDRFGHVGEALTQAGYALAGFDLRGHGQSGGPRGHTPSYEHLLDDIADFLLLMQARYPSRPVFLYGHSLGGNLVLNYALRRKPPLHGVIATSPWLEVVHKVPAWKLAFARTVVGIVPTLSQASGLETAALSRDPAVVAAYDADPLVHDQISVKLFSEAHNAGRWALQHAAEFPLPLLLMHGTGDRITSWKASQEFAEHAGAVATWRAWDGWFHELHNEPQKARVMQVMVEWMDARLSDK